MWTSVHMKTSRVAQERHSTEKPAFSRTSVHMTPPEWRRSATPPGILAVIRPTENPHYGQQINFHGVLQCTESI